MNSTRIISGLVIAIIALTGVLLLPLNILIFILSLIVGLSSWEFFRLRFSFIFSSFLSLLLFLFFIFIYFDSLLYELVITLGFLLWLFLAVLMLSFPHNKSLIQKPLFWIINGLLIHILFWFSATYILNNQDSSLQGIGLEISSRYSLIFALLISVLMDTIAYYAGKRFGHRKLLPNISPNKTLEGFGFAMIFTPLILFLWISIFQIPSFLSFFLIIFICCIFSAIGDATASLFKRVAGVKNSSNLIPGHGGVLDRIDSHLAAVPTFSLCILLTSFI